MPSTLSAAEIANRGEDLYERGIRARVERGNAGRFVVIDITRGTYEIADDAVTASNRAMETNPDAILYYVRVGNSAAFRLGSVRTGARL